VKISIKNVKMIKVAKKNFQIYIIIAKNLIGHNHCNFLEIAENKMIN
jgi:hypothetical protein